MSAPLYWLRDDVATVSTESNRTDRQLATIGRQIETPLLEREIIRA